MVLTVDIGNSNIVVGVWDDASLKFTGRIQTRRDYSEKELTASLAEMLRSEHIHTNLHVANVKDDHNEDACVPASTFEGAILSSVVPEITDKTLCALEKIIGKRPLLMGPFLHTGVDISDYAPGAIGMDRIVDLSAAIAMYGAPVMVCDLGTCTTITVAGDVGSEITTDTDKYQENSAKDRSVAELNISSQDRSGAKFAGKLIGGMICPGVQLSLDAEAMRASQLPQLTAGNVDFLLGKDTASNMLAGAVAGTGLMLSELAERVMQGEFVGSEPEVSGNRSSLGVSSEHFKDLKVVITGGLSEYVKPWIKCKAQVHYEQNLLLRGLYEIFIRNEHANS